MKITKKILLMFVAIFALSTTAQAIEVSLGVSAGFGIPFFRGKDAKDFTSLLENDTGSKESTSSFSTPVRIDLMIEVLPFLAIETGLGFENTVINYGEFIYSSTLINKSQIYIPIMLRGQYEYKIGVTYVAVGVKLGIPLG